RLSSVSTDSANIGAGWKFSSVVNNVSNTNRPVSRVAIAEDIGGSKFGGCASSATSSTPPSVCSPSSVSTSSDSAGSSPPPHACKINTRMNNKPIEHFFIHLTYQSPPYHIFLLGNNLKNIQNP